MKCFALILLFTVALAEEKAMDMKSKRGLSLGLGYHSGPSLLSHSLLPAPALVHSAPAYLHSAPAYVHHAPVYHAPIARYASYSAIHHAPVIAHAPALASYHAPLAVAHAPLALGHSPFYHHFK